jgi:hypothetical protein
MSLFVLKLIPTNPEYVPDESARQFAEDTLKSFFPTALTIGTVVANEVQFVWSGESFEAVYCPDCGTRLDVEGWWVKVVDSAYNTGRFTDLNVTLPCCNRTTSLNDLDYRGPQGFARFELSGEDVDLWDINQHQVETLEQILGCRLRIIRAHY